MAGAGTTYFTGRRDHYQGQIGEAQAQVTAAQSQLAIATEKTHAANDALNLLAQSSLTQAQAESLIDLYQKSA